MKLDGYKTADIETPLEIMPASLEISKHARKAAMDIKMRSGPTAAQIEYDVQLAINSAREQDKKRIEELEQELDWQNNRNSGHPTKGGFEFYINEEWTGLASAALDANHSWHAALRKHRIDPDDERVRVRRVVEDDSILKQIAHLEKQILGLRELQSNAVRTLTDLASLSNINTETKRLLLAIAERLREALTDAQRELEKK